MPFEPDVSVFPYSTIETPPPPDDLWMVRWRRDPVAAATENVQYFSSQSAVDRLVVRAFMTRELSLDKENQVHIRSIHHLVDGEWIEHEVTITMQYNVRKKD